MGTTFHPVSLTDVQRYLFDVADHLPLAATRAGELAGSEQEKKKAMNLYKEFLAWRAEVPRREGLGEGTFAATYARAMAIIAGFRHPYWFAGDASLSRMAVQDSQLARLFKPLGKTGKGRLNTVPDKSAGLLTGKEGGSGIITDLDALRRELARLRQPRVKSRLLGLRRETLPGLVNEIFYPESLDALERAIAYADARGMALMEAAGVAEPGHSGATRYANLRAHALGAIEDSVLPPPIAGEEVLAPPIPFVAPSGPTSKIMFMPVSNPSALFDVREDSEEGGLFSGRERLNARIGFATGDPVRDKIVRFIERLHLWRTRHAKRCAQVAVTFFAPEPSEAEIMAVLERELQNDYGTLQFANSLGAFTITFAESSGEIRRRLAWAADDTGQRTFLEEEAA